MSQNFDKLLAYYARAIEIELRSRGYHTTHTIQDDSLFVDTKKFIVCVRLTVVRSGKIRVETGIKDNLRVKGYYDQSELKDIRGKVVQSIIKVVLVKYAVQQNLFP